MAAIKLNFMKKLFFAGLLLCLAGQVSAQKLSFMGRVNLGIGVEYSQLDYNGTKIMYSPGGGFGLEAALCYSLITNLDAYAGLGFQQNLAYQYESMNGVSNKTSFTFTRGYFTAGVNKLFQLSEGTLHGFIIGAGMSYQFPGTLKITENNEQLVEATYKNALGLHLDAKLRLKFSETFSLDPGIRYRNLYLDAASTLQSGSGSTIPADLINLNASGLEFSATLVKRF